MDLQTLIEGKFDPVAAIRLLAYRVAVLEAQQEHSVVEGMPEKPVVQGDAGAPAGSVKGDDVPGGEKAAVPGAGGDAAGASEGSAKKSAPAKAATSKKKASA